MLCWATRLPPMNPSDPARPIQYQQMKRKATDAGLTSHEVNLLCQHVANCDHSTLSVQQAQDVLAWLIAVGPEQAKWQLYEFTGQRKLI